MDFGGNLCKTNSRDVAPYLHGGIKNHKSYFEFIQCSLFLSFWRSLFALSYLMPKPSSVLDNIIFHYINNVELTYPGHTFGKLRLKFQTRVQNLNYQKVHCRELGPFSFLTFGRSSHRCAHYHTLSSQNTEVSSLQLKQGT